MRRIEDGGASLRVVKFLGGKRGVYFLSADLGGGSHFWLGKGRLIVLGPSGEGGGAGGGADVQFSQAKWSV